MTHVELQQTLFPPPGVVSSSGMTVVVLFLLFVVFFVSVAAGVSKRVALCEVVIGTSVFLAVFVSLSDPSVVVLSDVLIPVAVLFHWLMGLFF